MGTIQNVSYFIPVVGTIHHARESYKLNCEYHELVKFAPSIKDLSCLKTAAAAKKNLAALQKLSDLPEVQKQRVSKYFANEKQNSQLAFWGSLVQIVIYIYIAAQAFHPVFLTLARLECAHQLYSLYKVVTGPDYSIPFKRGDGRFQLVQANVS